MRSMARAAAIALISVVAPAMAFAQGAGPAGPSAPPADNGAAPASSAAPATSAKPVVPATGYGWSDKPARKRGARMVLKGRTPATDAHPTGTVIPGFETLADGSSRLFVQMPRAVPYSAKSARGTLTYVLKGLRIDKRNNMNALVTVHFNTPVTSARLVPHGSDLWFLVDLRANVQPTVALDATKDGGALLRIEFPKGDYLGGTPQVVLTPADTTSDAPASPPPAGKPAPPKPPAPPANAPPPPPAPAGSTFTPAGL